MNAEQLLEHFHRIGDSPDAIPRLRRFILDLAVRGKLVPQDAKDETASELLKRIATEKARLVKAGEVKDSGAIRAVGPDEAWPVPASWSLVPLNVLAMPSGLFTDGDWVESKDQEPTGGVRLIQLADVGLGRYRDRSSRFMNAATAARLNCTFLERGDILIARMPDPLGRACIFPGDQKVSVTVVDVAVLRLGSRDFDAAYVVHAINAPQFAKNVESKSAGTTRIRISRVNLSQLPFPLPPLAEQHRIVAKVDELMALCDRLEAARAKREATRDQLAAASLARLNAPDSAPATFVAYARFALDNLTILTTRPDQIKQLRQTILNLAVRGKLVQQDPNDEPASELLKHITAQRARLVRAGKLREQKPLPSMAKDEADFALPTGWQWARMGDVVKLWNGYAFKSGDFRAEGVPVVRIGDLQGGEVVLSNAVCIPQNIASIVGQEMWIPPGALLIAMSGATTGKVAFNRTGKRLLLNQRVGRIESFLVNVDFVKFFFDTIVARNLEISLGTAIPNLSAQQINETIIPLPPLPEQRRIVAKVDELMALCDHLEASLAGAQDHSRRLLDALLAEALTATEGAMPTEAPRVAAHG